MVADRTSAAGGGFGGSSGSAAPAPCSYGGAGNTRSRAENVPGPCTLSTFGGGLGVDLDAGERSSADLFAGGSGSGSLFDVVFAAHGNDLACSVRTRFASQGISGAGSAASIRADQAIAVHASCTGTVRALLTARLGDANAVGTQNVLRGAFGTGISGARDASLSTGDAGIGGIGVIADTHAFIAGVSGGTSGAAGSTGCAGSRFGQEVSGSAGSDGGFIRTGSDTRSRTHLTVGGGVIGGENWVVSVGAESTSERPRADTELLGA